MIAASDLIHYLPGLTGIPDATVRGVYRKLNEAGILPVSRGAKVEKLNTRHAAMLILGLMVDVPAKDAAATARAYYGLTDENGNKIGDVLANMLDSFRTVNNIARLALKSRVEVDCDSPRVCIVSETAEGVIETLFGIRDKPWSDIRIRRSMTVSGKVLLELAIGVHFNRWPDATAETTKDI